MAWKQAFFSLQKILCKKESEKICMLIWTNFDSYFFQNWDSLHASLNSHYKAWSYKKKEQKQIEAYRKSV